LAQPLLAEQAVVHGVVRHHDGTRAADGRIEVACGDWTHTTTTGVDGTFRVVGAPAVVCTLTVRADGGAAAGVVLEVPVDRSHSMSIILPSGLAAPVPQASPVPGLSFDLGRTTPSARLPLLGSTSLSGSATSSAGTATAGHLYAAIPSLHGLNPSRRPDQWTLGVTATRPGPWGTLFTGTVQSRRQVGPSTLLTDVTGMTVSSPASWSLLFDPSKSSIVWDARLRLERAFTVGQVDLTVFGEAYRSFQRDSGADALASPLSQPGKTSLRTGSAGRVGLKVGF
jgi:hypothetical protein